MGKLVLYIKCFILTSMFPHLVNRSNHLGNGRDGLPLDYKWLLPYFPSGAEKRCVFRMR